jgi:hypothetical protein
MAKNADKTDLPIDGFSAVLNGLEGITNSIDPVFKKLTPEQMKAKNKVGIKRRGFLETAHGIVQKNAEYVPNFFDVAEFDLNMAKIQVLSQIQDETKKLVEYIKNIETIVGNEAYQEALSTHRYLREAAKSGMSGAKPLYQRMKKQFPNGKRLEDVEVPANDAANK